MSQSNLTVLSHWATLVEGMQASPKEFYSKVEEAVKKREIPDIQITRVDWKEGGVLSAKREYLRISRGRYLYDICAAPFGNGFFFSSWMAEKLPSALWVTVMVLLMPFILLFSFAIFVYGGGITGFLLWSVGVIVGIVLLVTALSQGESAFADHIFVMPVIGPFLERLCRPLTYYRLDTEVMFRTMAHNAVMEAVDATTNAQGVPPLTGDERKPILRDFFKR